MNIFWIFINSSKWFVISHVWWTLGCQEKLQSLIFTIAVYTYEKPPKKKPGFLGHLFRNRKEIPKNTKENRYRFCFGHNLLNMSAINLIPWQVMCVFPTLSIDTQLGHIHGHLWSGHNGHYGHFLKVIWKCRSPVKELNW